MLLSPSLYLPTLAHAYLLDQVLLLGLSSLDGFAAFLVKSFSLFSTGMTRLSRSAIGYVLTWPCPRGPFYTAL